MLETLLSPGDTEERCGLILKDGSIAEIENIAEDRTLGYRMNPAAVIALLDHTVGTWHTHPDTDPNLSGADYSSFLDWPDLEHSIIGWRNGKVAITKYRVERGLVIQCD